MNTTFADNFEDDFGHHNPAGAIAATAHQNSLFVEKCPKCRGTGHFTSFSGRNLGQCFSCKGKGTHTFKNSPEARAAARTKAAEEFAAAHPAIWQWLGESAPTFQFAASLLAAIGQYGSLTENQLAAAQRCVDKDAARATLKAELVANASSANVQPILDCFSTAGQHLKAPKLKMEGLVFSPAKKDKAIIYVKSFSNQYFGKFADGKFVASADCGAEHQAIIIGIAANPKDAAISYGKKTGNCCCCGKLLTNPESVALGIGPICAGRFGW